MLVKMLVSAAGPDIGAPPPGEVIEVPDDVAAWLVDGGLAEPAKKAKTASKARVETAAVEDVPETR